MLCAACLLINIIAAKTALRFDLPVYLDVIGNLLAAVLGGFIPAMTVGFVTNLINGIADPATTYYSFISLLIGAAAAGFARRKYFDRLVTLPVIVAALALIGGGAGSVLTWYLNGFEFGDGISSDLAMTICAARHLSPFLSQLSADIILDLFDKAISVAVTVVILQLLPVSLKNKFRFLDFHRRGEEPFLRRLRTGRVSLGDKVICFVTLACLLIAFSITFFSYDQYRKSSVEQQIPLANGVLQVTKNYVDADRINEYLKKGRQAEGYTETYDNLAHLMRSTKYIKYVYVYKILPDGCHVVFDPDTPDTPGEEPGAVIPFDEVFRERVPDLLKGNKIDPIISDERYGWLLTLYEPLMDSKGVCQGYAGVDIDMDFISMSSKQFLAKVFCLFCGAIILILTLAISLANMYVISPINKIARATGEHAGNEAPARTLRKLNGFAIDSKDEMGNLYKAVRKNIEDIIGQIAENDAKNEQIRRLQGSLIRTLAEAVESRDENTGTHIKNTCAYTNLIMDQLVKEGIYTDQIDDTFKANVNLSAALHDVGKISVSDTILNKPGKLTDEEFAIMKKHTEYGRDFLNKAMQEVGSKDAEFLLPAMRLALYHHEKWNGSGYPEGLKGEDIPLAARIMAVADVFDALVSERSYKKGFSYEKAMSIIKEGIGTHFDPRVAEAFIHAGDKVREIMASNMSQDAGDERPGS